MVPHGLHARFSRDRVEEALADTPITVIQGARQVGKSTLSREIVGSRPDATILSLDTGAVYEAARSDPAGFVRQTPDLLVIDEIQRVPELVVAMKDAVDEDRRPGRFLITGSANLLQIPGTEESLAGRAETVVLYGLSQGELVGTREDFVDRLMTGDAETLRQRALTTAQDRAGNGPLNRNGYLELACAGSYPEASSRPAGRRRNAWFDNYLERIVTRDARDVSRLQHIDRLPALVRVLAANNSGELVKARVAEDAGIPAGSVEAYVHLLETLYLIHTLPAWGNNLTSRVIGRPKVSILDAGLAARLANLTPAAMAPPLDTADAAGDLIEAFVTAELRRQLEWSETIPTIFHFRDRNGLEVDIVLEDGNRRVAGIEVKSSRTVKSSWFKGLTEMRDKLGARFSLGVLLYSGPEPVKFGDRLWALPLSSLWSA